MGPLNLEHSRAVQRADLLAYAGAVLLLATLALLRPAPGGGLVLLAWVCAGVLAWSLIEYLLHRFVLHGLPPFRGWHAAHHQRPTALIGLPTWMSAALFASLVFAPAWWLLGPRPAGNFMLGVLAGYLAYAWTHDAVHRPLSGGTWLATRRRWHARHHGGAGSDTHFGVTIPLWDFVFRSAGSRDARA